MLLFLRGDAVFNSVTIGLRFFLVAASGELVELSWFLFFYGDGSQSCQYAEGFIRHRAACLCNYNFLYSYKI